MFCDENFAPGSERYFPRPRYELKPVRIHWASSLVPGFEPFGSRFSIPNAPGAPSGS